MVRAFIAKAIWDIPTTRDLVERLKVDRQMRNLCGWVLIHEIPSEFTFSRAFFCVNRHSTVTHYQRPNMTHPQEGGTGGEVSEILFFSAKSKRRPSLIYSMQIIPVCLSIVARRKGVSATRRGGLNWTPISLLVGHPCKLFHKRDREQGETFAAMRRQHPAVESAINNLEHRGLDRVRSKGREGFARTVALAVVSLNVHRLGRVLRRQAREQHRLAA